MVVGKDHPTGNDGILDIPVIVRIVIQDDQTVGKLTGDIGVVAATFLGSEVHSMTSWITGQTLHEGIGLGIDDGNRAGQCIPGDHEFPVGAHRGLNRETTDRSSYWPVNDIVVLKQVDVLDLLWGIARHIDDGSRMAQIV